MKTYPSFEEEKKLWDTKTLVIGIDEVGRGAFAGPIVASAVIYPINFLFNKESILLKVNDSKKVNPELRKKLSAEIKANCLYFGISEIDVSIINKSGIGESNKMVFRKVVSNILKKAKADGYSSFHLLVDGFHITYVRDIGLKNQNAIIKGDQKSFTIASASILAKVHRDSLMEKISKSYPQYDLENNKGYGTKKHQDAIKKFGISDEHRIAFVDSFLKI